MDFCQVPGPKIGPGFGAQIRAQNIRGISVGKSWSPEAGNNFFGTFRYLPGPSVTIWGLFGIFGFRPKYWIWAQKWAPRGPCMFSKGPCKFSKGPCKFSKGPCKFSKGPCKFSKVAWPCYSVAWPCQSLAWPWAHMGPGPGPRAAAGPRPGQALTRPGHAITRPGHL